MGLGVNICALLVGLAAFAGWTQSRFIVPRFVRWVNLLGGVGILTLFFSIVSPNDGFQQELIRPPTPSVRLSAHSRVAPRRSPVNLSINAFVEAEDLSIKPESCFKSTMRSFPTLNIKRIKTLSGSSRMNAAISSRSAIKGRSDFWFI